MATHYVYVLPLHNEDWLKLGISNDPLRRALEFSPRYHEVFDLRQAFLVETEGRRDAASLEQQLRGTLRVHRAPMPLTINARAGGHTEWLRGAFPDLLAACRSSPRATGLHVPARDWFRRAQEERRGRLHGWASQLLREHLLDPEEAAPWPLPPALEARLCDAVDAFDEFGIAIGDCLPAALQDWYARRARPT